MCACEYKLWGSVGVDFDKAALDQLAAASRLPVSAGAALMPDAHVGYGLPIGGVLATRGAVIPYAVGVDIACRMKLSVLDLPAATLESDEGRSRLREAIESQTRFGVGAEFKQRREHGVMDLDWSVSPVTKKFKDRAWAQLGTSGSGNHFVEFGVLTVFEGSPRGVSQTAVGGSHARWDLAPGSYLALLSHSGSRGTGAAVCDHYSKLARERHGGLPGDQRHLGWLDMNTQEGREYWDAMNLMGAYAAANHACIHDAVSGRLGAAVLADVENHHNFAWKETHRVRGPGGVEREEDLFVHRKGATPAAAGVMGVIPGSMTAPGFVVVGKGGAGSLDSASHGAGRAMSRTQALKTMSWEDVKRGLREAGVELMSAGLDEAPGVYKDIRRVMSLQTDLVRPVARFDPRLVKMAPAGERAED